MQVMLSLDTGNGALDPRETTALGVDDDDDISDVRLGPGDKIVYLYKYVYQLPAERYVPATLTFT